MRSPAACLLDRLLASLQLFHELEVVVQPARSVTEDYIDIFARVGVVHSVEENVLWFHALPGANAWAQQR